MHMLYVFRSSPVTILPRPEAAKGGARRPAAIWLIMKKILIFVNVTPKISSLPFVIIVYPKIMAVFCRKCEHFLNYRTGKKGFAARMLL